MINQNVITIPQDYYDSLLSALATSNAFMSILKKRVEVYRGISYEELKMLDRTLSAILGIPPVNESEMFVVEDEHGNTL